MTVWQGFDPSLTWRDAAESDLVVMLSLWIGPEQVRRALADGVSARIATLGFGKDIQLLWLSRPDRHPASGCFVLFAPVQSRSDGPLPSWAVLPLDGTNTPIHGLAKAVSLALTPAGEEPFLRFFVFALKGQDARFVIVESADQIDLDLAVRDQADDAARQALRQRIVASIQPLARAGSDATGASLFAASLAYGDHLFTTRFAIRTEPRLTVEMLEEELVADAIPAEAMPRPPAFSSVESFFGLPQRPASSAPPAAGAGSRPDGRIDRDTSNRFVAVLLNQALHGARRHSLLERFNRDPKRSQPIVNFAAFLREAWPVVIIESDIPFIENLVADLAQEAAAGRSPLPVIRGATDMDDARIRFAGELPDESIVLMSLHAARLIADVHHLAHQIGINDIAALIGCEQAADVPEAMRQIADLTLRIPRIDERLFASLFEAIFESPLPERWKRGGASWVRYLMPSDFHQPRRFALPGREALNYLRERVMGRIRQVDPSRGPGLADLHGMGEARSVAEDLIHDIKAAKAGRLRWNAVDRGMLLAGPPGTGKTTLARAIAKDCGVKFVAASAASWQAAGHLGELIRAMRADFALARRYAPAIIFIDEIDTVGNRQQFSGHNAQYQTEVVNALLEQIQGLDETAPIFVIGATNHPGNVDPALRRAGRLDRVVTIALPNVDALASIYDYYLKAGRAAGRVAGNVDVKAIAAMSFGATGADVESWVRGAARRARKRGGAIEQSDLVAEATGKARDSENAVRLLPDEMRRVAVHEAGHALARMLNRHGDARIAWISIVPRADGALGFVATVPSAANLLTRAQYLHRLEVVLAGRAAEELLFGADGISGGAGGASAASDLAVATRIATDLVCRYGLSGERSLLWNEVPTNDQIDEIRTLLSGAYASAMARLDAHRGHLDRLVALLVQHQEISGDEARQSLGLGGA